MKIFHTGDVHLDSPFSHLGARLAEERRRDSRESFSAMMRYAKQWGADMVIISGDLFESSFVTRETVALLRRDFSMLDCPVVIAPGNHDPAAPGGIWERNLFPDNVYVFTSPSLTRFSFDFLNCDVYGWAFTSPNMTECPIRGERPEDGSRINILCAHCDTVSSIGKSCPVSPSVLRAFGADYCALGHIHNPENANRALDGAGLYCGCPEGRDFGECGVKGALAVQVEKGTFDADFIRFCKKVYLQRELNVDGASDFSRISEALSDFVSENGFSGDTLLRVVLKGNVDPSLVIDTKSLAEGIKGLFYAEVKDETVPLWNGELLSADKGISGEVYRVLLPSLESSDPKTRERAARALRYALAALNGSNISDM